MNKRYRLAAGTQVREEDFGLLFYKMNGPRLHFVISGNLLREDFFRGEMTLETWMDRLSRFAKERAPEIKAIPGALKQLVHKGVVVEC